MDPREEEGDDENWISAQIARGINVEIFGQPFIQPKRKEPRWAIPLFDKRHKELLGLTEELSFAAKVPSHKSNDYVIYLTFSLTKNSLVGYCMSLGRSTAPSCWRDSEVQASVPVPSLHL